MWLEPARTGGVPGPCRGLAAVEYDGDLWISDETGLSSQYWSAVAISGNGTKVVAVSDFTLPQPLVCSLNVAPD